MYERKKKVINRINSIAIIRVAAKADKTSRAIVNVKLFVVYGRNSSATEMIAKNAQKERKRARLNRVLYFAYSARGESFIVAAAATCNAIAPRMQTHGASDERSCKCFPPPSRAASPLRRVPAIIPRRPVAFIISSVIPILSRSKHTAKECFLGVTLIQLHPRAVIAALHREVFYAHTAMARARALHLHFECARCKIVTQCALPALPHLSLFISFQFDSRSVCKINFAGDEVRKRVRL